MNIILPSENFYSYKNNNAIAYVRDGILYIKGSMNYSDLMYDLTKKAKPCDKCKYCSNRIDSKNISIDHIFPKCMGGIEIPNNLEIICRSCNCDKDCFNYNQYRRMLSLDSSYKKDFKEKILEENEKIKYQKGFFLPKEWISKINIWKINYRKYEFSYKDYQKNRDFYFKYDNLSKPLIIDRNFNLLNGVEIYRVACQNKISYLYVIILENVEII